VRTGSERRRIEKRIRKARERKQGIEEQVLCTDKRCDVFLLPSGM
jgi:hypothetical protein